MEYRFSVIISTLNRPTLANTLKSLYWQTFKNFEIKIGYMPNANEYTCRNKLAKEAKGEILAFIDDDAYADRNWLKIANKIFENKNVMIATGVVIGNILGTGEMVLDQKYWGVGTNMFIRKDTFEKVNGFEENWGIKDLKRGWRSDTDLLWKVLEEFGEDSYIHSKELIVYHPHMFQSEIDIEVEKRFYMKWKSRCLKHFVDYEPRLCQLILEIEEDENIKNIVRDKLEEFRKKGII